MEENDHYFNPHYFTGDDDHEVQAVSKLGPPMKNWGDLGQRHKRKVTQNLVEELSRTAQARKVEPVRLVGNILRR